MALLIAIPDDGEDRLRTAIARESHALTQNTLRCLLIDAPNLFRVDVLLRHNVPCFQ